jgi:hypothetical protein
MKRPPSKINNPFADLADRLDLAGLRRSTAGARPSSPSAPNRRPAGSAATRPAVNFDHLAGDDQSEQLEKWQREQRHEVVQRGWGRAIENSGILGNRPPDSRSSPKAAQSWSTTFERAGISRIGAAGRGGAAAEPPPRTTASKSWDAAFQRAGIATKGPRSAPGQSGRRVIPVSRRRE